jgi:hypothetical protein
MVDTGPALPRIADLHDDQPNAMANDAGEAFYPDSAEDAEWFAVEHGARFVNADPFAQPAGIIAFDGNLSDTEVDEFRQRFAEATRERRYAFLPPASLRIVRRDRPDPCDHPDLTDDGIAMPDRNPSDWITTERIR